MWAAKLPGEGAVFLLELVLLFSISLHLGAKLLKACHAMCGVMRELGIAVDGGKDSLSMAARVPGEQNSVVKSPGKRATIILLAVSILEGNGDVI